MRVSYDEFQTATNNQYDVEGEKIDEIIEYLRQAEEAIVMECEKYGTKETKVDNTSDYEEKCIKRAIIEQVKYYLSLGGDIAQVNPVDATTGAITGDPTLLSQVIIAPNAKKILANTRFNYRGL